LHAQTNPCLEKYVHGKREYFGARASPRYDAGTLNRVLGYFLRNGVRILKDKVTYASARDRPTSPLA